MSTHQSHHAVTAYRDEIAACSENSPQTTD